MKELGELLLERRVLVVALGQMGPPSDMITRTQFVNWYVANVSDFGGSSLNRLLVKDQLGKSRTSSYHSGRRSSGRSSLAQAVLTHLSFH